MVESSKTKSLTELLSTGKKFKLPRGQVLQSSDNANRLFLIKRGYVKRYLILNEGYIRVQIIYGSGDIFPLTVAFKVLLDQDLYTGPETYYYETMCETDMYSIDKNELADHIEQNSNLYKDLFSESGRRLYFNIHLLENLGLSNSYKRLAHQIAFFARVFGEDKNTGRKITIPLTHQDMADILSVTRETVSQNIVLLRKAGLLKTGRNIIVPNLKKLEQEAYK